MNINTKSNFLEKKRQQRKKTEDQIETKTKIFVLQKNIRALLARKKLLTQAYVEKNVKQVLLMGSDISKFDIQTNKQCIQTILQQPEGTRLNYIHKIILSCMKSQQNNLIELGLQLASTNCKALGKLFESKNYITSLVSLLKKNKGYQFLNFGWRDIRQSTSVNLISSQMLFQSIISQFGSSMECEGLFKMNIRVQIVLSIMTLLFQRRFFKNQLNFNQFVAFGNIFCCCLKDCSSQILQENFGGLIYIIENLKNALKKIFENTITTLIQKQKIKNLLSLVEDEQQLEYFQHRLKSQSEYEDFCQRTLQVLQKIFHYPKIIHFIMMRSQKFRQIFSSFISQIDFIYDDRQILFVYHFLSDQASLKQMVKEKKMEFYNSLNMKLMTMDDEDFKQLKLFEDKQWRQIIQSAISKAFQLTKKMIINGPKVQKINVKTVLFKRGQQTIEQFQVLSDLLTNLNKKSLRTSKIPIEYFINEDLDKFLNTFKFGVGARAIQLMLKNFPFAFRFESRMKKFREFIQADKLNHDRSLFLQEQVDPDLIIEVRRGHQFLDAYHACYNKDLRKKYKIVFFNQQGLEQQGIDGGGIIKQFINRILKSSFSQIYGMFYETNQHQILPNASCPMTREYQFVGKIVGKAVYQSINIDQKFAEPFLNLLIGRQNTFQDLQFIDKQIYRSMVQIRRMSSKDLQSMQQTFTIMDQNPFGQKRIINLKNLSNSHGNKGPQVVVNSDNKVQFVMSYADYKCNREIQEKTRLFRKGFLTVMKSQWLTMFSNQELNLIISGSNPNFSVIQLKNSVVYNDYNEKSQTIIDLWSVLSQFTPEQKSAFLLYVTSCSRPPTMGFAAMKPLICIQKSALVTHLPTANTCMNVLRLPDYRNKQVLKEKLLYAINSKAGFQFA